MQNDRQSGHRLRAARKAAGWTMDELAQRSGRSRQIVQAIEMGTRAGSVETWRRLAKALNISVGVLIAAEKPGVVHEHALLLRFLANECSEAVFGGICWRVRPSGAPEVYNTSLYSALAEALRLWEQETGQKYL